MTKLCWVRSGNAVMILVLMGILTAAYYQQHFKQELPCPLCILQRAGMIGVAIGCLLNLRFGIRIAHYAFSLLSTLIGGAVAVRQICLHICPGFPIFGIPVYGLSLYTWSFITFCCVFFIIILFLFFYSPKDEKKIPLNWLDKIAFLSVFILTVANCITTLDQCGVGFCQDVVWPSPND